MRLGREKNLIRSNTFSAGFLLPLFVVLFFTYGVFAQPSIAQNFFPSNLSSEYIEDWLVLGPIPGEYDLDALPDLEKATPKAGDKVVLPNRDTLTWAPKHYYNGAITSQTEDAVSFMAYASIYSDVAKKSPVRFKHNRRINFWINQEHYTKGNSHTFYSNHDIVYTNLEDRVNHIRIWFRRQQSDTYFSITRPTPQLSFFHGQTIDEHGHAKPGALVELVCDNKVVSHSYSNDLGNYSIDKPAYQPSCFFRSTHDALGAQVPLPRDVFSSNDAINLTLKPVNIISGFTTRLDGTHTQPHIHVELIRESDSTVVASAVSNTRGHFTLPIFDAEAYLLRTRMKGEYWYYHPQIFTGKVASAVYSHKNSLSSISFRIPYLATGQWRSYSWTDGVPSNFINKVMLHSKGMLVCATQNNGICGYDGQFFESTFQTGLIEQDDILDIIEAKNNTLWAGTTIGVVQLYTDSTSRSLPITNLPHPKVNTLLEDSKGILWLGTPLGLAKLDPSASDLITAVNGFPQSYITSFLEDQHNNLWIGTNMGVFMYDGSQFIFNHSVGRREITDIFQSNDGTLWFASKQGLFSKKDDHPLQHITTRNGLMTNHITDICESDDGVLWLGTRDGLSAYDGWQFVNYSTEHNLISNLINSVACSNHNQIWAGTSSGISLLDRSTTHFHKKDGLLSQNADQTTVGVFDLSVNDKQQLSVATSWGGLYTYNDILLEKADLSGTPIHQFANDVYIRKFTQTPDQAYFLATQAGLAKYSPSAGPNNLLINSEHSWPVTIDTDSLGQVWLGHGWASEGINVYNPETLEIVRHFDEQDGLLNGNIWSLKTSKTGAIWIGSEAGIALFEADSIRNISAEHGLPQFCVYDIFEDTDGSMWFGTSKGVFHLKNDKLTHFSNQGVFQKTNHEWSQISSYLKLPENFIWKIFRHGDVMWFGSNSNGLIGYNGLAYTFIDSQSGLLGHQVLAIAATDSSTLWVGTLDEGLTRLNTKHHPTPVTITSFETANQTHTSSSPLSAFSAKQAVTIHYQENDFISHEKNRQFLIQIRDESGNLIVDEISRKRQYIWQPKEAGNYSFSVQYINSMLDISPPAQTNLTIKLPFSPNPWFIIPALIFTLAFSLNLSLRYLRQKAFFRAAIDKKEKETIAYLEKKNKELEVAKRDAEEARAVAEEATEAKSLFLSNMSHELRTPMTGVIGMASLLQETSLNDEQVDYLDTIIRSGNSLLSLINDILDFSKIENNHLDLETIQFDLRESVETVMDLMSPISEMKKLQLGYFMPESVPEIIIQDKHRFKQVLTNLLSNALKFTEHGSVRVEVSYKPDVQGKPAEAENLTPRAGFISISVTDTGIGIPEDRLDRLFKSFSQIDASTSRKYGGTGLGLAISKQLSLLMGGDLKVESNEGEGSTFTFSIKAQLPAGTSACQIAPSLENHKVFLIGLTDFEQHVLTHHLEQSGISVQTTTYDTFISSAPSHRNTFLVVAPQSFSDKRLLTNITHIFPPEHIIKLAVRSSKKTSPKFNNSYVSRVTSLYKPLKPLQIKKELFKRVDTLQLISAPNTPIEPNQVLLVEPNKIHQQILNKLLQDHNRCVTCVNSLDESKLSLNSYELLLINPKTLDANNIEILSKLHLNSPSCQRPAVVAIDSLSSDISANELHDNVFHQRITLPTNLNPLNEILREKKHATSIW